MRPKKTEEQKKHSFKINDLVLVKDPDSAVFEPRFQSNYRVTAIFSDNRIKVQDEKGHKSVRRSSHVKYVEPSEKVVQQLPSKKILQNYGTSTKLLIAAKDIPNLGFQLLQSYGRNAKDSLQNSEVHEHSINSLSSEAGVAV